VAQFYADENVPLAVTDALRALGHDVLTAQEDGLANRATSDTEILDRATALGRAVLTNNRRHFHSLHRTTPQHAGIITYTDDQKDRSALAQRIDAAVTAAPTLTNQLIRVIRPNVPPPKTP
jgi:predicted nuclease of predicted toxin-antitoxin system